MKSNIGRTANHANYVVMPTTIRCRAEEGQRALPGRKKKLNPEAAAFTPASGRARA